MHPNKHTQVPGDLHCAVNISKKKEKKRVERDGGPLQTISQCGHSGGRRRREGEENGKKKRVRETDREGRRTPNVK